MKVLVVGGGGREHSLAWKLAQSPHVRKVYCAPGNGGTATERKCRNVPIAAWDIESLVEWARNNRPDLTVVGPEDALFRNIKGDWPEGLRIWAPNGAQALLERSKSYMRTISTGFRIPSPKSWTFDDPDAATAFLLERGDKTVVVKASGPALGKGVRVCDSLEEAIEAVRRIMIDREFGEEAGEEVVIEERLSGPEMSLIALCGNGRVMPMPTAKDYKRAGNGDTGLNTGGMGCISPNLMGVDYSSNAIRALCDKFIQPIVTRQGYNATLYAGLMFDGNQPKLLE